MLVAVSSHEDCKQKRMHTRERCIVVAKSYPHSVLVSVPNEGA